MKPLIEFCHNSKILLKLSPKLDVSTHNSRSTYKTVLSTASFIIDFTEVLNLINNHKH